MSSKRKKTQQTLKKISKKLLAENVEQLVSDLLSGIKLETRELTVPVSVPLHIFRMVEEICRSTPETKLEDVIGEMATQGMNDWISGAISTVNTLQEELEEETEEVLPKDMMSKLTPGLSGVMQSLSQISEMAKQLTDMQKTIENAEQHGNESINKTEKNPA